MKHIIFLIGVLLLVGIVSGAPVTVAIPPGDISAGVVTFHGTGGVAPCWFSWGYDTNLYWTTPNQSVNGDFTDTQTGSPMLAGMSYNVRACDSTGCGNVVAFTVPKATLMNATHFGDTAMTIMRGGFNVFTVSNIILTPYAEGLSGIASTIVGQPTFTSTAAGWIWGVFFTVIFVGLWLQNRGIMIPAILAIMAGTLLTTSIIAVSPAFMSAGLPLLVIGLAGVFTSWFSNK